MGIRITIDELKGYLDQSNIEFEGEITDKNTALQMLYKTGQAWDFLSPKLKRDKDLMMCCQPLGFAALDYYGKKTIGVLKVGESRFAERGFEQYRFNGRRYIVPTWAKTVKGFNYKLYCGIQDHMWHTHRYVGVDKDHWDLMQMPFDNEVEHYDPNNGEWPCSECDVSLYDRDILKTMFPQSMRLTIIDRIKKVIG